ncbi:MAG: hypothetical protein K6A28_06525 [Bacteroidales bacterium]|nr:hypothetical protein [Bacteroidales bacterium]
MKSVVVFLISLTMVLASCHGRDGGWQNGDLIFVEGDADGTMDRAIMKSTGNSESTGSMVHVGIVEVKGDSVFVIDAAPKTGVSRRELEGFVEGQRDEKGTLPAMKVMRVVATKENEVGSLEKAVEKAKGLCGADYDFCFMPDNGEYYCSELVYECFAVDGKPMFEAAPMNFRNTQGEFDPYWVELFARQGMDIPQDTLGTNPETMSHADCLKEIPWPSTTSKNK